MHLICDNVSRPKTERVAAFRDAHAEQDLAVTRPTRRGSAQSRTVSRIQRHVIGRDPPVRLETRVLKPTLKHRLAARRWFLHSDSGRALIVSPATWATGVLRH